MTTGQQKRYFEFQDAKSAKFWEVTTDGTTVTVRYGKIGTTGQSKSKEFPDADAAAKHMNKLVAEKTGKGYVEQQANSLNETEQLITGDDELYVRWARDIGCNLDIQIPNTDPKDDEDYVPSVRDQISDWFDENYVPIMDELWEKYVPKNGACTVLQGEMSRCIGRLEGEYFRNGMMNMGDGSGYYEHMVDKIKNTVLKDGKFSQLVRSVMETDAIIVKGADYGLLVKSLTSFFQETDVEISLNRMKIVVAAWCISNPEPIEFVPRAID